MIAEKPSWIRHEGMQIFSIDIQPGGLRLATGGGDHKVRIWSMKSAGRDIVSDDSTKSLLATLRDHFGSVNCVRWAKHSRYVASGSDDQVIQIHERKPGSGTTEFGSGEPPDVENWKVVMTLRGHTADVVDLNWSPDDSTLASGSLDNTIHIWDMTDGICTAVLRGHSSLVKGVTWDPIGSFIASQSDDKTVIIWRTSDWSLAHRTDGHWAKSLGSTFFRRLGWSPCGHFITTTHGFQKPRHSAPVLERGEWSATFDFLGHNAPIIVVKFNHSMFRKNLNGSHEVSAAPVAWSNGTSKAAAAAGKESQPYNVIAIGSQDRTITVWTTASARPLFVAKHFFTQSVVDLSWSPDGYSLFACSLDGTVATFHFEAKELGIKLSDTELDELKRSRYGDVRGRQANLAESPAQLLLEAASAKQTSTKKVAAEAEKKQTTVKAPPADLAIAAKSSQPPQVNDGNKGSVAAAAGVAPGAAAAGVAPGAAAAEVAAGATAAVASSDGLNKSTTSTRLSSPVKQREYRRPDGRKRIIPEAVGVPSQQQNISNGEAVDFPVDNGMVRAEKRLRELPVATPSRSSGATAKATINDNLIIEKVQVPASTDGSVVSRAPAPCSSLTIRVFDKKGEDNTPVCLEARPRERAVNDIVGTVNTLTLKETEIACTRGAQTLWCDRISGKVTVLAGNTNFWAVGCEDGCLQVYTKCGRRAIPTMMMGSAATFIDCDESWKLLLITRKGSLYVWDLFNRKCMLHNSLESLIVSDPSTSDKGTIKVISAKLSKCGSPLLVLATRHAFLFDMNLMCWLRVADDCFPASNFASSWNMGMGQSGELASLQVDVRKYMARKPGWTRFADDGMQTRAHLEAQVASSLTLKSPSEYRQCLLSYIRFLAREADESRLREVCESFLGPPTGMAEATSSDATNPAWNPFVLGMKKHRLLREDILPAMASNRKVQRLLNEFMDLISEYEIPENTREPMKAKPLTAPSMSNQERDSTKTVEDDTIVIDTQIAAPLEPDSGKTEPQPTKTDDNTDQVMNEVGS